METTDLMQTIDTPMRTSQDYHTSRFSYDARRDPIWREVCGYLQKRYIMPSARILELGSGYCHFINNIKAKEKHAVDVFPEFSSYANSDVKTYVRSCQSLSPIADRSLDVVFASNLFEHLTREQLDQTLAEVRRVLSPGGRLIILQPNFKYCYKEYFDDYTHVAVYTERSLSDLLSVSGFAIRDCQARFLPFSMKARLPKSPLIVRLYLLSPFRPFAGQMLIVAETPC